MKEFLSKNRYAAMFVVAIVVAVGAYLHSRCEPATEFDIMGADMICLLEIQVAPIADLKVEACQALNREDNCKFADEDYDAIEKFIENKRQTCIKDKLKQQNKCIKK